MASISQNVSSLSAMLIAASLQAAPLLTAASISAEIRTKGAKETVDRLFKSNEYENVLIRNIHRGDARWIALAPALSEGADAATSEELGNALMYALPASPAAVLSVIDLTNSSVPRSLAIVCEPAFFEGDKTDPHRFRIQAIRAVKGVDDPMLTAVKRKCLAQLAAR